MTVFSLSSNAHRATEVDLFLEPPIDFETAYRRRVAKEVAPGVEGMFCGLDDLIELKESTDREVDREDVLKLRQLKRDPHD
jgi:hypothetical protein